MNVLYLTINPNRASTTVPTEGWFRCLASRGLKPVLVSHEVGGFHAWAQNEHVPAYHVSLPHPSKKNPFPFLKSLLQLRQIAKRHRIDLIHCNEQDCFPIGSYLSRITGLPVVASVHFTMERGFCDWAFGGWRSPDRLLFVSERNMTACLPAVKLHVPQERLRVLHNGIDIDEYVSGDDKRIEFRRCHGCDDGVTIGVACALRPRKQLEHLFEAAARIERTDLRVLLAGGPVPGDEEYARGLQAFGRERLASRLVCLGHLDDIRPFCGGLDLFINTSKEESFGIAVLEAMAMGCPVVGYDSKAVDEVVLPDGGEIIEQDNVELLSRTISQWINDPERLRDARVMARRQAVRFDIRKIADQLWCEYQDVLRDRASMRGNSHSRPVAAST